MGSFPGASSTLSNLTPLLSGIAYPARRYPRMLDNCASVVCHCQRLTLSTRTLRGAITAGLFLKQYVNTEKVEWAHLDIAGTAWDEKTGRFWNQR